MLMLCSLPTRLACRHRQHSYRKTSRVQASMADTSFGIMCASGSPAIAEAVAASGVDWLCIDAQHGPITYDSLGNIIAACSSHKAKVIVRVGGPTDKFGIQQALDLGAHGVMVPLVNSRADAEMAVSHCLFPPQGQRSVAYPVRAVYHKGVGGPGLSRYLKEANSEVEVWLQVETKSCFESMDEVLSVPGITSAFLGPCDLGITYGYHVKNDYDIGAMIASKDLAHVYDDVLKACEKYKITPGVFCIGEARAAELAAKGFKYVAYDTDLGAMMAYTSGVQARLKPAAATKEHVH